MGTTIETETEEKVAAEAAETTKRIIIIRIMVVVVHTRMNAWHGR